MKLLKVASLSIAVGLLASACKKNYVNKGPNFGPVQTKPTTAANCPADIEGIWEIQDSNTAQVVSTTTITAGPNGKKYVGSSPSYLATCAGGQLTQQFKDGNADVRRVFTTEKAGASTVGYLSESRKSAGEKDFGAPVLFAMTKKSAK